VQEHRAVLVRLLSLSICFLLSGCQLYGGASVHDTSADSEFKSSGMITTFGALQEINDWSEVFIQHRSDPFYTENETRYNNICSRSACDYQKDDGGQGVNEAGFRLKWKLF